MDIYYLESLRNLEFFQMCGPHEDGKSFFLAHWMKNVAHACLDYIKICLIYIIHSLITTFLVTITKSTKKMQQTWSSTTIKHSPSSSFVSLSHHLSLPGLEFSMACVETVLWLFKKLIWHTNCHISENVWWSYSIKMNANVVTNMHMLYKSNCWQILP